jgi:PhnB protein
MAVKPIPEGYHTVTPYLTVRGAVKLLEFIQKAFNATILFEMKRPDGSLGHAEAQIGDSRLMIGEAPPDAPAMPAMLYLYLPDADKAYAQAIKAGAESVREVATQFYGDRSGGVKDMCGNQWWVATHVEDVSAEEVERRAAAAMGK